MSLVEEAMMKFIKPTIGAWYRGETGELFEVVAIDDDDETIEIQYFDGTVEEMELDSWNLLLQDGLIDEAEAPEDWSGSVDIEQEDLGRESEDRSDVQWAGPSDYPRY
jgi:hypothetical protein